MRVAVAAGGAAWEAAVLGDVDRHPDLELARRCVDAADLAALAETGQCDIALVDPGLPGLDRQFVGRIAATGVRLVSIGDAQHVGIMNSVAPEQVATLAHEPGRPSLAGSVRGLVVAVWGPTGAPGRTTVAVSLAAAARAAGQSVVVVDADTYGGSIAQQLSILDDVSALMAACREENQGRLDDVSRHLVRLPGGLHVMTGIPRADMWVHVRVSAFAGVLDQLVSGHELVVVDLGFGIEPGATTASSRDQVSRHVLESADVVIIVGRADPVGIARLVRSLADVSELVSSPLVVLNGVRRSLGWSDGELSAAVRQLTGHTPAATLPWDQAALDQATMAGVPVRESTPGSGFAMRVELLLRDVRQVVGSSAACNG